MSSALGVAPGRRADPTQRFVGALARAMRNVTFYSPDHPLVAAGMPEASQALEALLQNEHEFTIKFIDGEAVVNDRPLLQSTEALASLIGACSRRNIESLTFRQGIRADELSQLVGILSMDPGELSAMGGPAAALEHQAARHIAVERVREITRDKQGGGEVGAASGIPLKPRELYAEAIDVVRNTLAQAGAGATIELAAANTTATRLVEAVLRESSTLLGLTSVKDYDEYTFTHMLHITLLCLGLGLAIGLDQQQLKELGVSALLHDVGKVNVPLEYLRKPGKLMPAELTAIQRHPVDGALILCKQPQAPAVAAIVAFEHHMSANLSGYPKVRQARDLNLYSMMVSVADVYDALTSQRPYRHPLSPGNALKVMHEMPYGSFHLKLLARFTEMLGKYPAGTLLRLSSGDLAVVSRPNPADAGRPFVRLLRDVGGSKVLDTKETDLGRVEPQTGATLLSIAEVLQPEAGTLNPGELLRDLLSVESY